jgi:hypothetical protein
MTIERKLPGKDFKELKKKSLCDFNIDYLPFFIDTVASTLMFNEDDDLLAEIIGKESDCDYCPVDGRGCHIELLEYAENVPDSSLGELLRAFYYGVRFGILDTPEGAVQKYNYIWFDIADTANSPLLSYYGKSAEEVCTVSDTGIHVFAVKIR